jgi:hypothetical protein
MLGLAFTLVVLATTCRAGDGGTPSETLPDKPPWMRAVEVAGRLRGRLLGCRIQKGMTEEEVDGIIGKDEPRTVFRKIDWPTGRSWKCISYRNLGLQVYLDDVDPCTGKLAKQMRVTVVEYSGLWE